jgi:hypothetical protein
MRSLLLSRHTGIDMLGIRLPVKEHASGLISFHLGVQAQRAARQLGQHTHALAVGAELHDGQHLDLQRGTLCLKGHLHQQAQWLARPAWLHQMKWCAAQYVRRGRLLGTQQRVSTLSWVRAVSVKPSMLAPCTSASSSGEDAWRDITMQPSCVEHLRREAGMDSTHVLARAILTRFAGFVCAAATVSGLDTELRLGHLILDTVAVIRQLRHDGVAKRNCCHQILRCLCRCTGRTPLECCSHILVQQPPPRAGRRQAVGPHCLWRLLLLRLLQFTCG